MVQEAAKAFGDSLRTLATNNPTYTHLSNFSGLHQLSDLVNSAAKKTSDSKIRDRQRVTPRNILRGKRVGPNVITDDTADAEQQLSDLINKKAKRDNRPENPNVARDKTYNRPLGRATHRYPTRNVVQPLKVQPSGKESESEKYIKSKQY